MANPSQYEFQFREVAGALMKAQGIHEGRWHIGLNIGINVANIGQKEDDVLPGAVLRINFLTLQRADQAPADAPLVYDAAIENPKK